MVAVCRQSSPALEALGVNVISGIDITLASGLEELAQKLAGKAIDVLINNAGIFIEDTWGTVTAENLQRQFVVNAMAPLMLSQALDAHLSRGAKLCFVTSRMGSITDNTSGSYYGYRMSKTALNMAGRSLAQALKARGVSVALLHPGYVKTDMTGHKGEIDPTTSVRGMLKVIDALTLEQSGGFWHTNGEALPW